MKREKLRVEREERGPETAVFKLSGDLYGDSDGYAFQEEVRGSIKSGLRRIVIDLGGVHRVDSAGIGILISSMMSAQNRRGAMVLSSMTPRIQKLLSVAWLLEWVDHARDVDEALARLDELTAAT